MPKERQQTQHLSRTLQDSFNENDYSDDLRKALQELSKEELIERVVSLERSNYEGDVYKEILYGPAVIDKYFCSVVHFPVFGTGGINDDTVNTIVNNWYKQL